jgi:alpha-tubulin suppressor-like RCC1 family protein
VRPIGAADPGAYGWGNNQTGEVADGTTVTRLTPVKSVGLNNALTMSVGEEHGLALLRDGSVVAWGHNRSGQLGNGTTNDSHAPVAVHGLPSVKAIAAGDSFSMALASSGAVLAWGKNRSGELGHGDSPTDHSTPVPVVGLGAGSGVIALAGGNSHALALKGDGSVLAWGNNESGQLGNGAAPTDSATPVHVHGLGPGSGVVQIAAGGASSFALKGDGTVLAWGNNHSGQAGDASMPTDHPTPVQVKGLGPGSGVIKVVAGFSSAYALKRDGTVVAWGNNRKGETGSGDAPKVHPTPVPVVGLSGIIDIAAGWQHGLALAGNGALYSWGDNALGQLGTGNTTARSRPEGVAGFGVGSGVLAVYAGGFHSHILVGLSRTPQTSAPNSGGGATSTAPSSPSSPSSPSTNGGSSNGGASTGSSHSSSSTQSSPSSIPASPVASPVAKPASTTG